MISIVHTINKSTITFDINYFKTFLTKNGKILSLDTSKTMIGTALSDDRKKVALSHVLIERTKLAEDLNKIDTIIWILIFSFLILGSLLNIDNLF